MLRQIGKGWVLGLFAMAILHMGAIVKKRDPIYDETLTGPISLKDKMEETKDGVKGAPSPSYKFYTRSRFLSDPPLEASKENLTALDAGVPDVGENIPENLDTAESKEIGGEWWDEDGNEENSGSVPQEEAPPPEEKIESSTDTFTAGKTSKEKTEASEEWWAEEEPEQKQAKVKK